MIAELEELADKVVLARRVKSRPRDVDVRRYVPQTPWPKQQLFLDLDCLEAFYGGAAGPGKSSALLMAALQHVYVPGYAALLLRRTYADLSKPGALMDRAHQWLRGSGATWNEQKKQWTFPSTATLSFGYMETENDKYQYQGAEYQFIGPDEVTQLTESQYTYLFSRLRRLKGSRVPIRMRPASNPGGVGAAWVYERFVPEDFTPEMAIEPQVFWKEGVDEDGRPTRRAFVPARLEDNPAIDYEEYVQSLNQLDTVTREQLLKGDWNIRQRGNILSMYSDAHVAVTTEEFARVFGSRGIPATWLLGVYQDWGTTPEHPCVTTWLATAPASSPVVNGVTLAGSVFAYRGMVTHDSTVKEVAEAMIEHMGPKGETARVGRWQMSHEASSERIAYQREHHLPFSAWPTGKTRGIAQLRGAFELRDRDKPHPFRPELKGHPRLYFLINPSERINPRTDAGLVRHRAEAPAYRWATLKSGEPLTQLVPHALFNDAMDTLRAAAADYFPLPLPLSADEEAERKLPPQIRRENLPKLPPEERARATAAHDFWLAETKEPEDEGGRFHYDGSFFRN